MKIKKILNNNVALVDDEELKEIIVWGKGLVFNKKTGDLIDPDKVEKIFPISDSDIFFKFQDVLEDIPLNYFEVSNQIIAIGSAVRDLKGSDVLLITLSDHIYSTIKRYEEGVIVANPLVWDIKRYYPDEYKIGLQALDIINKEFHISLPEDEAGYIAMHIINVQIDTSVAGARNNEGYRTTIIIQEILNVIRFFFKMELDEESANYHRFVTHLKYFTQKMKQSAETEAKVDNELYQMVSKKYVNSFSCVEKIGELLKRKHQYELTKEDELYLTVHIQRIIYNNSF